MARSTNRPTVPSTMLTFLVLKLAGTSVRISKVPPLPRMTLAETPVPNCAGFVMRMVPESARQSPM